MSYSTSLSCISLEVFFFFAVAILDVVIYQLTYLSKRGFQPFHRGFFCNDQDIMKPLKPERLSFVGVITAGTVLSLIIIAVIEVELYFKRQREEQEEQKGQESKAGFTKIPYEIIRMVHRMGIFGSGLAVLILLCQVVAIFVGRLRPHFLAVCKPDTTLYNCSHGYITRDVCTGDPLLVKRARLSFPSLHTAVSTYSLVFVAMCLHCLYCLKNSKILCLTIQTMLVLLAISTGLSRIGRYYHHYTDIIGGLIAGAVMAWIVAVYVMKLFVKKNKKKTMYTALPSDEDENDEDTTSVKKKLMK